jgi:3-hydroxypropionyl-CoA synthetase (ADP-forming)
MASFEKFFAPKSVAVIGVSETAGKLGHEVFRSIISSSYQGQIFAINPRRPAILGFQSYTSLQEVPLDQIDLVVHVVELSLVPTIIREASAKATKCMVIVSGGGREQQTQERIALENEIRELARKYGIRVIGPNCIGLFSGRSGLDTFFQSRQRMLRPKCDSNNIVNFLTQSGTVGCSFLEYAAENELSVSKFVSYGNRVDVSEAELIYDFAEDAKVIGIYVEGIEQGRKLISAISRISVPVVILKGGRTLQGAQASISHTGWHGGSWEITKGVLCQAGALITYDYRSFFAAIRALATAACSPKGNHVALLSNGAGPMVSAIDWILESDLKIATFDEKTIKKLTELYPAFYQMQNPLDLTGSATAEDYQLAIESLLSDDQVDIIMPWFVMQDTPLEIEKLFPTLREVNKQKPILCGALGGPYTKKMAQKLTNFTGVQVFETPAEWTKAAWALNKGREVIHRSNSL